MGVLTSQMVENSRNLREVGGGPWDRWKGRVQGRGGGGGATEIFDREVVVYSAGKGRLQFIQIQSGLIPVL